MADINPEPDGGDEFDSELERLDAVGNREERNDPETREWRIAAYQRQMEAEERLYEWWEQRHEATTWVTELLGFPVQESSSLWVAVLGAKVAAMGGHLELVAVFEDEMVTLVREPGPGGTDGGA